MQENAFCVAKFTDVLQAVMAKYFGQTLSGDAKVKVQIASLSIQLSNSLTLLKYTHLPTTHSILVNGHFYEIQ